MVLISLVSVLNLLYFYISTFRSMCAVPNMAVFCSSLTSCFPGMLLTYFLNDFEIDPVAPIITGITYVFTFHMRCISIVRSLYLLLTSYSYYQIILCSFSEYVSKTYLTHSLYKTNIQIMKYSVLSKTGTSLWQSSYNWEVFFLWICGPTRTKASSFVRFLDHT